MPYEAIAQVLATIGAIVAFVEWKYRGLHSCVRRIENRLDTHLDK